MQSFEVLEWLLELLWDHAQRLIKFVACLEGDSVCWAGKSICRSRVHGCLFDLSDAERDARSGDQWLLSIRSYLEWRAGKSWRQIHRKGERWNSLRWHYLGGIRLLNEIRYQPEPGPALALPLIQQRKRHLPSLAQVAGIVGVRA